GGARAGEGERPAYRVGRRSTGDGAGAERRLDGDGVLRVVVEERREATELDEAETLQRLALGLAEPHDPPDDHVRLAEGRAFADEIVGQVRRGGEVLGGGPAHPIGPKSERGEHRR